MKKIVPPFLVIVFFAATAAYFIHRSAGHKPRAAELVSSDTVFFAQLPDLRSTAQRFTKTELFKLANEPEVRAFLERPRTKAPQSAELQVYLDRLERLAPREAFFAVASIDATTPQFVAGFAFNGSRRAADEFLSGPRENVKQSHPAGKAELVNHGTTEIETFTDKEFTMAQAFSNDWCFIANDLQLLERTLDRCEHPGAGHDGTLAGSEMFKKAIAPLPLTHEVLLFAQLGKLTERLASLLTASGQPAAKQLQELQKVEAIAAATKVDDTQFRDTIFVLVPGSNKESPLTRASLAFASPATLLYYAAALPAKFELPDSVAPALAMFLPALEPINAALAKKGLGLADLGIAFGPELGTVVDWTQESLQPNVVLALDVRDAAKAQGFIEILTGEGLGHPAWEQTQQNGLTLYLMQEQGLSVTRPTLALTSKFLLLGLSSDAVTGALARLNSGEAKLSGTAPFRNAERSVTPPTNAYGYVDLRALFERVYGTFRPFLAMSLAFMPDASQYIDASKLPSTEAVSKHLGSIVYSQSTSPDGVLLESTGTITVNQALAGIAAAAITATVTKGLATPPFDLTKLLGLPGTPAPVPAPAPQAKEPASGVTPEEPATQPSSPPSSEPPAASPPTPNPSPSRTGEPPQAPREK